MIEIFAYAIGVMYTPGPVNLLSLNTGLNGHAKASTGYYFGVGSAMLLLFLSFGWLGSALIGRDGLIMEAMPWSATYWASASRTHFSSHGLTA